MLKKGPACLLCGREDNESGLFAWIDIEGQVAAFCPGECTDAVIDELRNNEGQPEQADELEKSIAQQMAGGWRENACLLEEGGRADG